MFIHKWIEPYLPLFPNHRASPHFGWYSFPAPLKVGGWVGLGGLVKCWGGLLTLSVTHPSGRESNLQPSNCKSSALTTWPRSHCVWTEIADERRRLKATTAEFNEQEKLYDDQRRRHIAQQQRVKKEERKAAAEAQQQELYVHPSLDCSLSLSSVCRCCIWWLFWSFSDFALFIFALTLPFTHTRIGLA